MCCAADGGAAHAAVPRFFAGVLAKDAHRFSSLVVPLATGMEGCFENSPPHPRPLSHGAYHYPQTRANCCVGTKRPHFPLNRGGLAYLTESLSNDPRHSSVAPYVAILIWRSPGPGSGSNGFLYPPLYPSQVAAYKARRLLRFPRTTGASRGWSPSK